MASPREEAERIAREGTSRSAQLRRQIRRLFDRSLPWQRLFRPGGDYSPDAIAVLADLAHEGFLNRPTYDDDPRRHALNEGKRMIALHVFKSLRLDTERLAALTKQLKETEDE